MQDNFKKYGYSFQIKLIAALFKDRLFLQQISDILDPSFMESEANQWIVKTILEYFAEFNALPTLEVIRSAAPESRSAATKSVFGLNSTYILPTSSIAYLLTP